jgi:hypothetical protein
MNADKSKLLTVIFSTVFAAEKRIQMGEVQSAIMKLDEVIVEATKVQEVLMGRKIKLIDHYAAAVRQRHQRVVEVPVDRPWSQYPDGTRTNRDCGGYYIKTGTSWKLTHAGRASNGRYATPVDSNGKVVMPFSYKIT